MQSVFADRVEDLVRKNERPAIHCRSALVAQERREVSAGIRSREGRSERNGSGVLVCDGRPHILGADILGAAEVPGAVSLITDQPGYRSEISAVACAHF